MLREFALRDLTPFGCPDGSRALDAFGTGMHGGDVEAERFEVGGDEAAKFLVVVDHEHACKTGGGRVDGHKRCGGCQSETDLNRLVFFPLRRFRFGLWRLYQRFGLGACLTLPSDSALVRVFGGRRAGRYFVVSRLLDDFGFGGALAAWDEFAGHG